MHRENLKGIRHGLATERQGKGIYYAKGRYQHPTRPQYSTVSTSIFCLKGCVISMLKRYHACKRKEKRRNRGEKKEVFTKFARSSPVTRCLRIPACNGKVRAPQFGSLVLVGFVFFLLMKKVLNTKRKESAPRRKELVLVGCFYLEKGI